MKGDIGENDICESNYERVGGPLYFSITPSMPFIGDFSQPFGNLYLISESGND